jgi:hypothetical protein
MLVTPAPVGLLIGFGKPGKFSVFAMVLFYPHTIGAIFMAIPVMFVVVCFVMVNAIVSQQRYWRYRDRGHQGGSEQSRIQKTGAFLFSSAAVEAIIGPSTLCLELAKATNRRGRAFATQDPFEINEARLIEGVN